MSAQSTRLSGDYLFYSAGLPADNPHTAKAHNAQTE